MRKRMPNGNVRTVNMVKSLAYRVLLFSNIVWREWELGYRISVATAWEVAGIVWP